MKTNYFHRLHDQQLADLVISGASGNVFLIGPAGSGKSAALIALSNELIDRGIGFQLLPCLRHRDFVPPLAKLNLVDDLDSVATTDGFDGELIRTLADGSDRSLNIIALRNVHEQVFRRSLNPRRSILISPLDDKLIDEFVRSFMENSPLDSRPRPDLGEFIQAELSKVGGWHPRSVSHLMQTLWTEGGQLRYSNTQQLSDFRLIQPQLTGLGDTILTRIRRDVSKIDQLSPVQFEELVAELFVEDGYAVELTQQTRDGGVDIFAWRRDVGGEFLTLVQCKKHKAQNPVRVGVIREVVGSLNIHDASAAAIFTTSYFTAPAKNEVSRLKNRMSLTDYFRLVKLLGGHGSSH